MRTNEPRGRAASPGSAGIPAPPASGPSRARPGGRAAPRRASRARRWLRRLVALLVLCGGVFGGLVWVGLLDLEDLTDPDIARTRRRAQALALALSENLPVYRVQLRTTTCSLPGAGTDNAVQVKLNATNSTWLDYSHNDFERGADFTYDLGLDGVDALRDVAMLEVSKRGDDAWCLRALELYVNNDRIFARSYPPAGRWLAAGATRTLTVSGAQLRRNAVWRAYRPSLPPKRLGRAELESRIESAVGNALYGSRVTWRRLGGRAVELERATRMTYRGALHLEARLENWPDPEIHAVFQLAVSCRAGALTVRVRELTFAVDSPWYADAATLGMVDRKIERTLEQAVRNVSLRRTTSILVCPPALAITRGGDLLLY